MRRPHTPRPRRCAWPWPPPFVYFGGAQTRPAPLGTPCPNPSRTSGISWLPCSETVGFGTGGHWHSLGPPQEEAGGGQAAGAGTAQGQRARGVAAPARAASPAGQRLESQAGAEGRLPSVPGICATARPRRRTRMLSVSGRRPRQLPRWRPHCADGPEAHRKCAGGTSARPSSYRPPRARWRR